MGQYWCLVNVDKRVTTSLWCKLGEYFLQGDDGVLECLLPPHLQTESVLDEIWLKRAMNTYTGPRSQFLSLAPEIISMIFETLDIPTCFALAVTCTRMFFIGQPHIVKALSAFPLVASWAGDRIVAIGDYAVSDDLPPGLLTEYEAAELADSGERPLDFWSEAFAERPTDVEQTLTGFYYAIKEHFAEEEECHWTRASLRPWSFASRIIMRSRSRETHVPGRVLRNLSKRVYVREDAIAALPASYVSLGDVMLARICWSSDPSASIAWDGPIARGPWAGDRFDIVVPAEKNGGSELEGWADATEELVKDFEEILKAQGMWKGEK